MALRDGPLRVVMDREELAGFSGDAKTFGEKLREKGIP